MDLKDNESVHIGKLRITYHAQTWNTPTWEIAPGVLDSERRLAIKRWIDQLNKSGTEWTCLQYSDRNVIYVENIETVMDAILRFS